MANGLLGEWLVAAAILQREQVTIALTQQRTLKCPKKLGEICVTKGWLAPQTVAFFLQLQQWHRRGNLGNWGNWGNLGKQTQTLGFWLGRSDAPQTLPIVIFRGDWPVPAFDFVPQSSFLTPEPSSPSPIDPPPVFEIAHTPLLQAIEEPSMVSMGTFFGDWCEIWDGDYCWVDG